MKRLAVAVAVLGLLACQREPRPEGGAPADTPAVQQAAPADTMKMPADTGMMQEGETKKAP